MERLNDDTAGLQTPDGKTPAQALFTGPCDFIKSVAAIDGLPPANRPEIAFVGRSNVGKSSLINALTQKKDMCRTSNTPGRTQHLNFFDLGGACYIIDLPGYGYAEAPKKLVDEWNRLIRDYLRGRVSLKRVLVLIDSRHGLKANDREFMKMLDECAAAYMVVLTKTDKIKPPAVLRLKEETEALIKKHPAAFPTVFTSSSVSKDGLEDLREILYRDLFPE